MKILISIFLALFLILANLKIKVKIYLAKEAKKPKITHDMSFGIYLFGIIKLFKINLKNDGIYFLFLKFPYNKLKFDKNKMLPVAKKIRNFKVEKTNINLIIGIQDAMTNAILIGIISGIIGTAIRFNNKNICHKNCYYKMVPVYNCNLLKFDISLEFSAKFINYCLNRKLIE